MNRPYIFCHMMTSLDGKIAGSFMETPQGSAAGDVFYDIAFGKTPFYKHQGWLSGRVTTDDNFTFYKKPALDEHAPLVPEGDFIAQPDFGMFYVSIDPHGKLGWEDATLHYIDTTAHVIEVLTEDVSNSYKAFLRKLGISYIIAGKKELDYTLILSKLKELFHIETLMLGGGGVLNWSFLQAGMCDEISVVLAAAADGGLNTPPLFREKERLSNNRPLGFSLKEAKVMDGGSVWLRYTVDSRKDI
ncbi:dihydrofolate reductase family protein [Brotaphodocola sp.]|uniref:dihydrofolate reductase family protein n=1 Tax=Brotaphodocola sp. TaxID=3073577 RepID=UPI003D7E797A